MRRIAYGIPLVLSIPLVMLDCLFSGTQASYKIKFLHVGMASGDLPHQMQALANAVVIAKLLNATLVVPALKSDEDDSQKHGCVAAWSMIALSS